MEKSAEWEGRETRETMRERGERVLCRKQPQ